MPETNRLKKAWSGITTPLTDLPSRMARGVSEKMTRPNLNEGRTSAQLRGFAGGAVEGAGDLMSGMTSPLGIATSLAGAPWVRGLMRGGKAVGKAVKGIASPMEQGGLPLGPNTMRGSNHIDDLISNRSPIPQSSLSSPTGLTSNSSQYFGLEPRQMPLKGLGEVSNEMYPNSSRFRGITSPSTLPSSGSNVADKMSKLKKFRNEAATREGRD